MTGCHVGFRVAAVLCLTATVIWGMPVDDTEMKSYKNYKVIRTQPLDDMAVIPKLMEFDGQEEITFWKYPAFNQSVDIMASPDRLVEVQEKLQSLGLQARTVVDDVEELFKNQNDVKFENKNGHEASTMTWDRYHRYEDIMNYAKEQSVRDGFVTYEAIGTSTEGREIGLVKISSGGEGKPAIFIDGGMHAREWISPATVTYMMNSLISDNNYTDLLDMYDWYFVPIINVDGYEYTHTRDRMWRKTRRPNPGSSCYGTDPNRNWDFHWGGAGTSHRPCSDIFKGPRAFSEPETIAVAQAIMARREQIKIYLTFHSYSQLWLLPWSYTRQRSSDYQDLYNAAAFGARALARTYGTSYKVGTAPELLYEAAGGSDDWAKGAAGIKYSYTIELRDKGYYGFALPASQIKTTGQETLNGVAALAKGLHPKVSNQAPVEVVEKSNTNSTIEM